MIFELGVKSLNVRCCGRQGMAGGERARGDLPLAVDVNGTDWDASQRVVAQQVQRA